MKVHLTCSFSPKGLPPQWSKLLTASAITKEDYAKDPQAVLDVLEFYTDRQKREMEEMTGMGPGMSRSTSAATSTTLSSFDSPTAPRFGSGTGFAASSSAGSLSASDSRPMMSRQDSAPNGLSLNGKSPMAAAAARAAQQVQSNTIGSSAGMSRGQLPLPSSSLQATRPAPPAPQGQAPRPLLTAGRPAPPAPKAASDYGSSPDPYSPRRPAQPGRTDGKLDEQQQHAAPPRKDSLPTRDQEREREAAQAAAAAVSRPPMAPAKSAPANSAPATQPAPGPAGAMAGPPPVKPLQMTKKLPKDNQAAVIQVTGPADEPANGSVAAAAAALEKPKEKERRISTMTEAQIMDKLRSVVCPDDPRLIYNKMKKIGQGCVVYMRGSGEYLTFMLCPVLLGMSMSQKPLLAALRRLPSRRWTCRANPV